MPPRGRKHGAVGLKGEGPRTCEGLNYASSTFSSSTIIKPHSRRRHNDAHSHIIGILEVAEIAMLVRSPRHSRTRLGGKTVRTRSEMIQCSGSSFTCTRIQTLTVGREFGYIP